MENRRGRPFAAGNKFGKGRPEGSRNKATLALEELLKESAAALITKGKVLGLQGDVTALKMCWDRLIPIRKGRPVRFKLPSIRTVEDIADAHDRVLALVADGSLTPEEGQRIGDLIDRRLRAMEQLDMEARLQALEARQEKQR
jgi:hypothetical protein